MIPLAEFDVVGTPGSQGSKTRYGKVVVEGSSPAGRAILKAWRTAVAEAARAVNLGPPLDGPVAVSILFRFQMPKSRPAAVRKAGVGWHTVKPDKDKTTRATFDALVQGGLIKDDARICWMHVEAIEVDGWTGATITVGAPGSVYRLLEAQRPPADTEE